MQFFILCFLCLCITLAETYVRQGKYVEAVKTFEKEIHKITGDLDLDSITNSTDSSSSKNTSEAKGENKTITIESVEEVAKVGKEVEKVVGKNSTEVNSDEINAENKKKKSSPSNPILPTTSNTTSTSSSKRSYTEEFHKKEIKVLTTIEKNKLKLLHVRLGNIYGNYLLDLKLAAFNYEKTLEYGGDMTKEIRMFFAKNAHDLETLKKNEMKIKMGVNPGVEGTKKVNVSLSDHISNVLNNSSNKNQNQTKGSGQSSEKVQIPIPSGASGDGKQIKGPKAGPAVPSRRNRWVVRSDVVEEDGAQGGGPGEHAGLGDGAGAAGGMKMGGMGKINGGVGGVGGEEGAERGEVDARRQGAGGAGGGGGQNGESSFESQIRRKEELQEAEEEERIRTGTSSSTSASAETGTTASAVLSALSSNRRGR